MLTFGVCSPAVAHNPSHRLPEPCSRPSGAGCHEQMSPAGYLREATSRDARETDPSSARAERPRGGPSVRVNVVPSGQKPDRDSSSPPTGRSRAGQSLEVADQLGPPLGSEGTTPEGSKSLHVQGVSSAPRFEPPCRHRERPTSLACNRALSFVSAAMGTTNRG
jgi:hypothetical protein